MASPPTGKVTFLFTDIQGSTRLWERDAQRMQSALARHDEILKGVIVAHDAGWADLADEVVHLEAGCRTDALLGSAHG